jgi:VIT1/CCC1 family predicted Fe2+/Mn2+ transporter
MLRHSIKTGLSFGLTSGTITTLGLMVGLHSGTHERIAVLGGILTIAIADAFSDALGIHIAEESENKHTEVEIWEATIATFLAKFIFAMTFAVPLFIFQELGTAIVVSAIWGLCIRAGVSVALAREQHGKVWQALVEHLGIALVVIVITHYVGDWIGRTFQ